MHELSIALKIVDAAAEHADRAGGRVVAVHLKLGALAGVEAAALRSAFGLAREGTPLAAAELVIEALPVAARCSLCAVDRAVPFPGLTCPVCGTPTPEVVRGRELEIAALEVADP